MEPAQVSCSFLDYIDGDPGGIAHDAGRSVPTRSVGWVLRWAAAIAVLSFAGCVLAEFAYCLAAEHTLTRAARAGAMEATLPRASVRSVGDTVKRRLVRRTAWAGRLTLSVHRNGAAVGGAIRAAGGDRITVTLAVPVRAVLPHWLSAIGLGSGEAQIEVRAEREVPGRSFDGVGSL
jgi:hypothetical protein